MRGCMFPTKDPNMLLSTLPCAQERWPCSVLSVPRPQTSLSEASPSGQWRPWLHALTSTHDPSVMIFSLQWQEMYVWTNTCCHWKEVPEELARDVGLPRCAFFSFLFLYVPLKNSLYHYWMVRTSFHWNNTVVNCCQLSKQVALLETSFLHIFKHCSTCITQSRTLSFTEILILHN